MLVSTDKFTYNKEHQQFVGEMSDLGPHFKFERVYPDAMDLGFTLVSSRTGCEVKFVQHNTCYDNEGDISYWILVPAYPKHDMQDITVTLWND